MKENLSVAQILLAENNVDNQQFMTLVLTKYDYQCTSVQNGQEVLDILRDRPFDVIVIDMNLPGLYGMELYELIRNDRKWDNVGIIILTASCIHWDRESNILKRMRLSGDSFISKPIDVQGFVGAIEDILRRYKKSHLIVSSIAK